MKLSVQTLENTLQYYCIPHYFEIYNEDLVYIYLKSYSINFEELRRLDIEYKVIFDSVIKIKVLDFDLIVKFLHI